MKGQKNHFYFKCWHWEFKYTRKSEKFLTSFIYSFSAMIFPDGSINGKQQKEDLRMSWRRSRSKKIQYPVSLFNFHVAASLSDYDSDNPITTSNSMDSAMVYNDILKRILLTWRAVRQWEEWESMQGSSKQCWKI